MTTLLPVLALIVLLWAGFVLFLCDDNRVVIPKAVQISEGLQRAAEQFNRAMRALHASMLTAAEAVRRLNAAFAAVGRMK